MGYKIQFETGHTVEFDTKPSDADIEEAYNHIKNTKALEDQNSKVFDMVKGAGETALSLGTSAVAMPAGFIAAGLQKLNNPSGINFEKQTAANMDQLTYQPRSELGKEYTEKVGKVFNDVGIPAIAHLNGVHLPSMKEVGTQIRANRGINEVPPTQHPALAAIEAAAKPAEVALDPQQAGAKAFQAINDRLGFQEGENSPMRPVADPMATMADTLVQRGDQERASNADAGIARREEIQTDAVNRQTALDLNAAERQRQENAPTGYEAIKAAEEKAKADAQAEMQRHQAEHEALQEQQRQLDASRATDEARAQAQEVIDQRERQLQADVQRTVEQARKNAEDIANRRAASQTASEAFNIRHEAAIKDAVENHPFLKAAEDKVDALKVKLTALEDAVANGETNAVALVATRNALKKAIETRDKTKTNLTGQARSGVLPKPSLNSGKAGKQRGAVDPEAWKAGFKGRLKHLSELTDKLAWDFDWQNKIKAALGSDYLKNKDGTPMVLLHGTTKDITGPLRGSQQGFHAGLIADSTMFVEQSGKNFYKGTYNSKRTMSNAQQHPLVVKAGNYPKIPYDAGDWTPKHILTATAGDGPRYGIKSFIKKELMDRGVSEAEVSGLFRNVEGKRIGPEQNQAFSDLLKRAGIDGFFYENKAESPLSQKLFDLNRKINKGNSPLPDAGVGKRFETIVKNSEHPTSFVTWNDSNFKSIFDTTPAKPLNVPKSQRGAVLVDWKKKEPLDQLKKVAGIRENLRHLFPEEITGEQLVEKLKDNGAKDVDQNLLQRGINHLTKGSLYQAIKTDNPVIKFVGEKFRAADNQIKRFTGEIVHDKLAPLAQDMTKHEKAVAWSLQTIAEQKGFELTPEFLRDPANKLNEKQIAWIEGQKEMSKAMLERINSVQATAGKAPISPRVAYLATRARGDFRKLVYDGFNPSGEPKVVGILGDNTRMGLNKQVEQLKAKHPEYTTGEERFYGGHNKKGTADGFEQLLEFLSENDPKMKDFVDRVNDLISDDAYNFMNAKTHTMNKKGVFGMEGKKLFESASKNAEDGMAAQIRYAETIIRWSELSKAVDEVKPLLAKDNGVNMPNAKAWAEDYIQGALGNSPGEFGKHLDNATAALGKTSGVGVTIPGQVLSGAKKLVNGMLLGFVNVGFNAMNMIQPVKTMPEMAMWLKTKGVDVGVDMGLGRALTTMQKDLVGMKLTDVETAALKYAKDNHVYSSSLFESGNRVSKDIPYYWDKGTQFIAKDVEAQTRKLTYLAYVHMLHESGVKPKDGLFQAAQNATDIHMNNYAQAEAPKLYQETGAVGRSAYNLMSFKHNELSRTAMLAREIPNTKEGRPLLVAIASQIAFAGMMGMIGYHEADALYQFVTSKMGNPTSLTKLLLDNPNIPDFLKYGMGSKVGLDLTNRMGVQVTPGNLTDALAPGASKVGTMVKAAAQVVTQPNEYNAKNMVREFSPNSVQGIEDRAWFSGQNAKGEELAMNRNKVQASAVRNQTDKLWKTLGLTGVNESKQKALDYENNRIDQVYKDKRKDIVDNAAKVLFTSGKVPADFARNYIKAQGDPNSLAREITTMAMEQKIDRPTLERMRNAMSSSLTSMHKLLRETGKE